MMRSDNVGWASDSSPTSVFAAETIEPSPGAVVSVGQPLVVRFTKPVADRAAAELSITITSSKNTTGRFVCLNDAVVQWIPDGFWPAHTHVAVLAGGMSTSFETAQRSWP